jgi:hypothetical protein
MPSTDTPTWWADVQQEREDLQGRGRRPADDWLGEDIDFVPRRRLKRAPAGTAVAADAVSLDAAGHPLHGVFVAAPSHGTSRTIEIELSGDERVVGAVDGDDMAQELRHLHVADDPFSAPPPPAGTRRTVQITGRPGEGRTGSQAQRHRPRTTSDRVGHRPDRVALWAVLLGAILILLAAASASSEAATAPLSAPAAKVAHVTPAAASAFAGPAVPGS